MTTTSKNLETNRQNANKSSGPRTQAGKARSAQNAQKYGILSEGLLIDGEDSTEYDALLQGLIGDLKPGSMLEMIHAERIAMAAWRLRRLVRAESAAIAFHRAADDTRKMLNDTLGIPESIKFKEHHLEPLDEEAMRYMGSLIAIVEEMGTLKDFPEHEEALKKAAPVYYNYVEQEAAAKKLLMYKYLLMIADIPDEERLAEAIKKNIQKDHAKIQLKLVDLRKRLNITMMRERYQEMKVIPPETELFARYQTSAENSMTKAIKALREAQELRLSVIDIVAA